jgi:hypothetical protein
MIWGVWISKPKTTMYCIPFSHKNLQSDDLDYNPTNLPLQSHKQFMAQAKEVQSAETNAPSEKLAQQHGINGVPLLSILDSLDLPLSTGYKFMHLVFKKIVPNLALLWSGSFKNFDRAQPFVFDKTVWDAIGAAAGVSRVTMPSSYGARVPNIVINRLCFSAETWFQWVLFVGPVVLDGQFSKKNTTSTSVS